MLLGWALFAAAASFAGIDGTLTVSPSGLIAIALIGALVGVVAGWRPASRAAKLNVLAAIASE
jgi:putative ABC transport system permease protein